MSISAIGTAIPLAATTSDAGRGAPMTSGPAEDLYRDGTPDVTLALSDLILDPNGEVVLFNDSQFRSLELLADSQVIRQGVVGSHVTAGGDDVSGFRFISFASGLTLFHDASLAVLVRGCEV